MKQEDADKAREMLREANKLAKNGTRAEYRKALKDVEDFAGKTGQKALQKSVNKKRNETS